MASRKEQKYQLSRDGMIEPPGIDELRQTSAKYGLGLSDDQLQEYGVLINGSLEMFNRVALIKEQVASPKSERHYWKPEPDANFHNAWYVRCNVQDATSGKLYGKKIAIKDNVAVAGIPMMNGSKIMEGYVPEYDATVVQRILQAGGCIVGKATCEDLCFSGGSFMTANGPVRNPVDSDYSAGGSSSGSAVAVALGDADMAIGGDQGGSVRIPASSCGLVGLKPTHGLVPYTGAMPIVPCLDHLGPIARSVADAALLLEVIAGHDDGRDYRQANYSFQVPQYSKLIHPNITLDKPVRIGILQEGVELCEANVQNVFMAAVDKIKMSSCFLISHVSLPAHTTSLDVSKVMCFTGALNCMIDGCGFGVGIGGLQNTSLVSMLQDNYKQRGHDLGPTLKLTVMLCDYLRDQAGPFHFAKACSLGVALRHGYDALLRNVDVLIMPTLNNTPCKIPPEGAPLAVKIGSAFGMIRNTAVFDITGHPALTINAGYASDDKMPVGVMIVGKHFDELCVLNAGALLEELFAR